MSKYKMINVIMGRNYDYNDKLLYGRRSLKYYGYINDEDYLKIVESLRLIDCVVNVYKKVRNKMDCYVRIIVEEK